MVPLALNDGRAIPPIGLGMYQVQEGDVAKAVTLAGLGLGYRLIDTAAFYGNERSIGDAIRECGLPREDIFVTSKLHPFRVIRVRDAIQASLDRLATGYIDLYLVHWPFLRTQAIWDHLQQARADGLVRSIGVSNFTAAQIERLVGTKPAVNQVEFHPLLFRKRLAEFCASRHILIEAHTPLTHGRHLNDPRIAEIARNYDRTPAQILLRWAIQQKVIPLPKSLEHNQLRENIAVFDFEICVEDMNKLNAMNANEHIAGLSKLVADPTY